MEKIDRKVDLQDDRIRITSTSMTLLWRLIERVDEMVEWIDEHERIMIKDRDWLLARLKMMEEGSQEQAEATKELAESQEAYDRTIEKRNKIKERQARGEHDPK